MSDKRNFPIPTLTPDTENRLWKEAIFVWDTSAICSLYGLTPDAKDTFVGILDELKDRTWIPARVMTEYDRHRGEMLGQIISEPYKTPEFLSAHYLSKLDAFIGRIKDNPFHHPQFNDKTVAELSSLRESAGKILDKIRIVTETAIKDGTDKVKCDFRHDIIFDEIQEMDSGSALSYEEVLEIVREGDARYRHRIPPGYMDEAEKQSVDRFGDLIIWKEIIRYAASQKKPVIFICDDVKEDWNVAHERKGAMVPREELIEEFRSATGKDIWFYTLNGFIDKLIRRIGHDEVKENNDQLTAILRELQILDLHDDCIKVVCENCGYVTGYYTDDFSWEWEYTSTDDRGMGSEICFEYEQLHNCPECGHEFEFKFEMYQYPLNVVNYVDVEAEGCKIVSTPHLEDYIERNDYDACVRCGEYSDTINDDGFCQSCMDEFDYECNRDD